MSYEPPVANCSTCGEPIRPDRKVWVDGVLDERGQFVRNFIFPSVVCCKVPT